MFNQRNIFQNANNYSFNTQTQPVNYKMGLNNNGIPNNYGTTFNNNSYASNQVTPETGVNNPYVTTNDIFKNKNTLMPSEFLANPSLRPQFMDFKALTPEQKQNYGINFGNLTRVVKILKEQQSKQDAYIQAPAPIKNPLPNFSQSVAEVRYPDLSMQQLLPKVIEENGKAPINIKPIDFILGYAIPASVYNVIQDYNYYSPLGLHDKFKHSVMNCHAAQQGIVGNKIVSSLSDMKEYFDKKTGNNTIEESEEDMAANLIGRYLGKRYPHYDCKNMISHYISKKYPQHR